MTYFTGRIRPSKILHIILITLLPHANIQQANIRLKQINQLNHLVNEVRFVNQSPQLKEN